ncbi:MAG TPA: carbohydrate ABC transporter permease [Pseudonocardiaceae bacterium]|nr:carbohydrate ABC transporter permease [Pseudonocardiaceae bacterium]
MATQAVSLPQVNRRKPQRGNRSGLIAYLVAGIVLAVVFVLPLLWAVLRSLQPTDLITAAPTAGDFTRITGANYAALLTGSVHILEYVGNSVLVAVSTAVLTAVVATAAGYGLGRSKLRFRGAGLAFTLIIITMMVPFQAILTPLFMEMNFLHLTNSRIGLVLFYTACNLPFGVFVMRNSFLQVPRELEDAAYVDGASVLRTLTSVMRPLVVPGIATTALYAFLFAWNEFLGALTFLTDDRLYTLPVALFNVETSAYGKVDYGYLLSGAVIAMIPCIILYVALQRYYLRGLVSGAIKG